MLTAFDKELLNILQTNLPIASRPFAVLAERIGVDEETVISRLNFLKQQGFIRRIGPFFDSASMGYVGTLVALQVEEIYVESVAEAINAYPGVTHNYEREGEFNLWFALLAPSLSEQEKILQQIEGLQGVVRLISLPATQKFKVSVQFRLE